jgi:polyisoprenoid-binding protein YceI
MNTTPTVSPTRVVDNIEVPAVGKWTIDPGHAQIGFAGRHLKFTKVRGRFADITGVIHVTEDPNETTVEVTIAMTSIESGNPTRDDHLRSADLFDVDEYPTATFTGQARNWVGARGELAGELTIKDVTRSVVLDVEYHGFVTDPWGGDRIVFSATGTIDREDWGVMWNMALEAGGLLVSKRIDLEFELEAVYERSES